MPFRRSSLSSRIHGVPEGDGVGLDVGVGFHVRVDMVVAVRAVVVGVLEVGGLVRDRPVEWGSEDAPAVFTGLHLVDPVVVLCLVCDDVHFPSGVDPLAR